MKNNKNRTHWLPVLTLLILAPVIGELLSGSSPPAEYFQPMTFILLTMLYGTGALVIRETVQRWGGGWLSILLLGFAYGIFEEGIVVHSFFDPTWGDLGILATYGRWLGVNWIWTAALTLFHGVMSISVPIALTEMIFTKMKGDAWLGRRGYTLAIMLFFLNTVLAPWFVNQYSILGYAASAAAMIVLFFAAHKLRAYNHLEKCSQYPRSGSILIAGFVMMFALIAGLWILPALSIPWQATFVYLCALPWLAIRWLRQRGVNNWGDDRVWSLCFGLLLPWLILSVISELDNANRPDDTSGMIITALIFCIFLIVLQFIARKKTKKKE